MVHLPERGRPVAKILDHIRTFCNHEDGATVVEYVLMLALIAIVCMAGVAQIGQLTELFFNVANTL
jgi:Flp pilus assembly pilin Flp